MSEVNKSEENDLISIVKNSYLEKGLGDKNKEIESLNEVLIAARAELFEERLVALVKAHKDATHKMDNFRQDHITSGLNCTSQCGGVFSNWSKI